MPDFENDVICISLDKKIGNYAEAVRNRQIERAQYLKKFGYRFDVNNRFPYPYDDNVERRLINEIDWYLLSFDEAKRAEVNGHFLREYQHYLSTPFAKHARELAVWAVKSHPLPDKDKLDFLNYLFAKAKQDDFDKKTLYKLADYNPNDYLEATNRLYVRALSSLGKGKQKKDAEVAFIMGMLDIFAERVETSTPEMVVNYAKIYFRLADKTAEELTPWFLGKLATKTPQAQAKRRENQRKNLDKETINLIFEAYAEHVVQSKEFNVNLADSMIVLAETAIRAYEYTPPEAKKLTDVFKNKETKDKSRDISLFVQRLNYLPVNPLSGIDLRDEAFKPTAAQILGYASYLCRYAAYYPDTSVGADDLMYLLKKNASNRRLDVEEATLFREAYKKKAVDKNLVLGIAKIYGETVRDIDLTYDEVNEKFGSSISKMFKDIVANYNYNGREARAISNAIALDKEGNSYAQEMSKNIFATYTAGYKRRYRAVKSSGKGL